MVVVKNIRSVADNRFISLYKAKAFIEVHIGQRIQFSIFDNSDFDLYVGITTHLEMMEYGYAPSSFEEIHGAFNSK